MAIFGKPQQQSPEDQAQQQANWEAYKRRLAQEEAQKRQYEYDQQMAQFKAQLNKYGLDFDSYSDEDLQRILMNDIAEVTGSLRGTGLYAIGDILTLGSGDTGMIMTLLQAQISQNWILVRQNEQILRELRKLNGNR